MDKINKDTEIKNPEPDTKSGRTGVIQQGQIWRVTNNNFFGNIRIRKECEHCGNISMGDEKVRLKKGDYIEIRYPYKWHFRTEDNRYLQAEPDVIYSNAEIIGQIREDIKFNNRHELKEILEQKLYLPVPV